MLVTTTTSTKPGEALQVEKRQTSQPLLPQRLGQHSDNKNSYEIHPFHCLESGRIYSGYDSLATWIMDYPCVVIEGYSGVLWQDVRAGLSAIFENKNIRTNWIDISEYLKTSEEIEAMVAPYLGSEESLWGKKCLYKLEEFFQKDRIEKITINNDDGLTIVYGSGAALLKQPDAPVIYIDVPKNETQYRMRAGAITNLGCKAPSEPTEMYKRFYFIDWPVLNAHKKLLLNRTAVFADAQWLDSVNWMLRDTLLEGLNSMSNSVFRVRPWFEAGAWGGQWMKERFPGINKAEVNYAWSFELIVPENGIVFESDGYLVELSFDYLMFANNKAVLGESAEKFGDEFPIRFDFLDTWDGGNLSIQCHPSLDYIRSNFGETITQDETYYILDCKEDATVYLGFQEGINPDELRTVLENSRNNNEAVAIEKYVQVHHAKKHDLFLIPNGTVHSAGANNLVLEISATPYIFTFKMYDWVRLGLNGEPRAINIEHAFNNLNFERNGGSVKSELISSPKIIERGEDWELLHLPTHADHLYDVHRIEFETSVLFHTNGSCHVLMLVEGTAITLHSANGTQRTFHYAETFVIPAAAHAYRISNQGTGKAKVVKAFIKENIDFLNL